MTLVSERQELERELERKIAQAINDKQCDKCSHLKVCGIYKAFAPLIENTYTAKGVDEPIDPKDLAKICKEFLPLFLTPPRT